MFTACSLLFHLPMQGKLKTARFWWILVKLFVCPVTKVCKVKDSQTATVCSVSRSKRNFVSCVQNLLCPTNERPKSPTTCQARSLSGRRLGSRSVRDLFVSRSNENCSNRYLLLCTFRKKHRRLFDVI